MLIAAIFAGVSAALVLLATLVVLARPRDMVNRALAAYLVLHAGALFAFGTYRDPLLPGEARAGLFLLYWTELPLIFALPFLLDALFGARPRTRTRAWALAAAGALALGLTASLVVWRGPMFETPLPWGPPPLAPGELIYGISTPALHIGALVVAMSVSSSPARSALQRKQAAMVGLAFALPVVHAGLAGLFYSQLGATLLSQPGLIPSRVLAIAGLFTFAPAWRILPRAFEGRARVWARVALLGGAAFALVELVVNLALIATGNGGWYPGRIPVLLTAAALLIGGILRFGVAGVSLDMASRRLFPRRLFLQATEPLAVAERARIYGSALRADLARGRSIDAGAPDLAALRADLGLTSRDHELLVAATESVPPGTELLLGRYVVERTLGRGATSLVHLARDTLSDRQVVIKEIRDARLDAATYLAESRALARVRDPHVVRLLGAESVRGRLYLVLQHAPGGTLAERLARGSLSPEEASHAIRDVLAGLAACHAAGIVHGDLKAENVLFDADGRALLADLGSSAPVPDVDATVRLDGPAGSPASMAPELFLGEPPSIASDLFAVGALAHRALTGDHYVRLHAAPQAELARAVVFAPPPVAHAAIPREVFRLIERALSKDPRARPESAAAFREAWTHAWTRTGMSMRFDKP